ncbi:MAG: xylulokinase [Oscillospiraceae bacterium]
MKYLLAHDLGTSGDKATLFSEDGKMLGSRVASYDVYYFNKNWAEQDADDWWNAFCHATKSLIEESGIDAGDIAAVSFSGQMMGCLCVDKEGRPLRRSIIWADSRSQKQSDEIAQHISQQDFYHIVGHRNTPSYGVQKLMWVRDNEPEIYANTYKVLNAKDYITFKLTGAFCTDYSDANSMACFDINTFKWSDRLISYAGIDGDKLPDAMPSTHVAGGVTEEASRLTGLAAGTPIVVGGGDGSMANVGAGSIAPGKTYSCMGTSAWITTTSEKPIFDESMRTVTWCHVVPGLYAPNGTMQAAGASYSWLKDTVCCFEAEEGRKNGISPYKYIDEQVAQSVPGSNGVIFLPYLMGERAPRWNPEAKGAFIGLKAETKRSDMLRSVLEGVTMNLAIVLDSLRKHIDIDEIIVIGGGAKGAVWRQIMADVYNTRIVVPTLLEEAGAMGAAVTGGVGVGLYKDFTAIDQFLEISSACEPNPEAAAKYVPVRKLFDQCYDALESVFPNM